MSQSCLEFDAPKTECGCLRAGKLETIMHVFLHRHKDNAASKQAQSLVEKFDKKTKRYLENESIFTGLREINYFFINQAFLFSLLPLPLYFFLLINGI